MARAGLKRKDRRVGQQLNIDHRDLGRVGVEDDRAVHLRDLVEERWRIVDLEADAAREHEADLFRVTDDNQTTGARVDDVVNSFAQRCSRRNHLQSTHQRALLAQS